MKHEKMRVDTDSISDLAVRKVVDQMLDGAERDMVEAAEWVASEASSLSDRLARISEQATKAAEWTPWTMGGISTSGDRLHERIGRMDAAREALSRAMHWSVALGATRIEG